MIAIENLKMDAVNDRLSGRFVKLNPFDFEVEE